MRALILAAGAALTVAACSSGNEGQENNSLTVENLEVGNIIMNDPAAMNGTTLDANALGTTGTTGMDPATANAVSEDLTTNDADTNLANGM